MIYGKLGVAIGTECYVFFLLVSKGIKKLDAIISYVSNTGRY
jgi:hypothetical protein